jgi:predicted nucleic acid-binding protein
VICADTSFLVSFYGHDANSHAALEAAAARAEPIAITVLNQFELENAIRFATFSKAITLATAHERLAAITADITAGQLDPVSVNLGVVVREARRLSARHSLSGGHRSFDILHVAAAVELRATEFLSFDKNQRALAKAAGLKAGP